MKIALTTKEIRYKNFNKIQLYLHITSKQCGECIYLHLILTSTLNVYIYKNGSVKMSVIGSHGQS